MATAIGKAISCPSDQPIDWGKLDVLPDKCEVSLDLDAINARLAPWRDIPIRWRRGIFRAPSDASPLHYQKIRNAAVKAFIREMDKQGWDLHGRIQVAPSRFQATTESGVVLIGQSEYVIRAQFQKRDFRPLRVEIELPAVD